MSDLLPSWFTCSSLGQTISCSLQEASIEAVGCNRTPVHRSTRRRFPMVHSSRLTFSSAAAMEMAAASGSGSSSDEEPGEEIESAPPLRVGGERAFGDSGQRKRLLRAGQGWATPVVGDEVPVHYVGSLRDGTGFASTREGGKPRTIKLGDGELVAGLECGICTMKKGEKALFVLPAGYGDTDALGVPPGSELYFEVELLCWLTVVDICKDGGIVKKILSTGGNRQTEDLDEVTVRYKFKLLDGSVVEETPEDGIEFYVNEGHVCPALPKVLKTMKEGEKAVVMVQPQCMPLESKEELLQINSLQFHQMPY